MSNWNEWIIERNKTIKFPSDINDLTPKQFLRLIEVYYLYPENFIFRFWVFWSIARISINTKIWLVWNFAVKKLLSKFLPINYKVFGEGELEHTINLFTEFLMENDNEILLAKQLIPKISIRRLQLLDKFSPTFDIKGHNDYCTSMSFGEYREAEKAFFECNLNQDDAYNNLIKALYRSNVELKDWQLDAVSETIKKAVYFWYNDIREYWKRQFEEVFSEETKAKEKLEEFTPEDLEQQMTTWLHYVAKEDPTKYEVVNNLPVMTVLFNWNELKIKRKAEEEFLKKN